MKIKKKTYLKPIVDSVGELREDVILSSDVFDSTKDNIGSDQLWEL